MGGEGNCGKDAPDTVIRNDGLCRLVVRVVSFRFDWIRSDSIGTRDAVWFDLWI